MLTADNSVSDHISGSACRQHYSLQAWKMCDGNVIIIWDK